MDVINPATEEIARLPPRLGTAVRPSSRREGGVPGLGEDADRGAQDCAE